MSDVVVEQQGAVTVLEINRPENNFFDVALIEGDRRPDRRARGIGRLPGHRAGLARA